MLTRSDLNSNPSNSFKDTVLTAISCVKSAQFFSNLAVNSSDAKARKFLYVPLSSASSVLLSLQDDFSQICFYVQAQINGDCLAIYANVGDVRYTMSGRFASHSNAKTTNENEIKRVRMKDLKIIVWICICIFALPRISLAMNYGLIARLFKSNPVKFSKLTCETAKISTASVFRFSKTDKNSFWGQNGTRTDVTSRAGDVPAMRTSIPTEGLVSIVYESTPSF